jgi:hypothetical protein
VRTLRTPLHEKYHIPTLNSKQISWNSALLQIIDNLTLAGRRHKARGTSGIPNFAFSDSKNRMCAAAPALSLPRERLPGALCV